jgi:hypothetical protein
MNRTGLAVMALLSLLAPLAQAMEVGQCGSRNAILKALANEGQRVVVSAREYTKRAPATLHVVRSKVDQSGYLLRQDRRKGVCVTASLAQVRIGEPGGSARSDQRLVSQNCSGSARNTRRNGSLCGALQRAGKAVAAIDPDTFVDSAEATVLGAGKGQQGWRAAQFGFCKIKDQGLVLCLETYTRE